LKGQLELFVMQKGERFWFDGVFLLF
jgi:hypothetical protein